MDSAMIPNLKTIMVRDEMIRFMTQLDAISAVPFLLTDKDSVVVYESASIKEISRNIALNDGYRFPINLNDAQIGTIVAYKSNGIDGDELEKSIESIGQMLTDRLIHELNVDNLASQLINSYQELNLFYELSIPLSSVLNVEEICSIVLEQAVEIVRSERAFMMLLDSENEQLVVTASADAIIDLKGLRVKIEDSIYENLIQNGVPLVIEDVEKYPHLKDKINRAGALYTIPLICVPVMIKGEVSGLISMSRKPSDEPYTSEDTKILFAMALQAGMSLGNARLYENLHEMFINTVEALAAAVEAKDPFTHGHCQRVAEYSIAIGEDMGLPGKEIVDLRLAGILHDVGKVGIPESILSRPEEIRNLEEIKNHPVKGAEIVEHIEQMSDIAIWIRHHHERYNGTGYPDGLREEQIPLHSRILAVADEYDSITSNRGSSLKYPHDAAVMSLRTGAGSLFDPEITEIFLNLIRANIYEQYLEAYQNNENPQMPRLNRFAYYRIDNEINSILEREVLGNDLSDSDRERLCELRELVLRC